MSAKQNAGNSLVVQWLGLCVLTADGPGSGISERRTQPTNHEHTHTHTHTHTHNKTSAVFTVDIHKWEAGSYGKDLLAKQIIFPNK